MRRFRGFRKRVGKACSDLLPAGLFLLSLLYLAVDAAPGAEGPGRAEGKTPQRVEIAGGSYYFKPDRVTVKIGEPVELVLRNESFIVPHNFVLKAPEAGIDIKERLLREPVTVTFTPRKAGEYPFYCDNKFLFMKSHREKGMEGVLVVVE